MENDSLRAKRTRGVLAWLATRESASRRMRVLPIPGAPVTVTTMGVRSSTQRSNDATICASSASRPTKGTPPPPSFFPRSAAPTTALPSPRSCSS